MMHDALPRMGFAITHGGCLRGAPVVTAQLLISAKGFGSPPTLAPSQSPLHAAVLLGTYAALPLLFDLID